MITGESLPVSKTIGDELIGATINKQGALKFKATKVGKETALAQIIKLVEQAQGSRAPIQRIVDQVSAYFVPAVIGLALAIFGCKPISFLIASLVRPLARASSSLPRTMSVIIMADVSK